MSKHFDKIPIILILFIAVFLRLYNFDRIPYGLNHDGALESLEAIEILNKPLPYKPYSIERPWLGETLFRYYLAAIMNVFGINEWAVKLGSSLIAIATIPFFYIFVKEIFDKKVAIYATFLFAISGWHIIMGKSVWRALSLPFFEVITLYFLLRTLKTKKYFQAALTGILLSLTLNTYAASRIIPAVIIFISILFLLHNRKGHNFLKSAKLLFIFLIFFILTILPLVNFYIKHPGIFNSRTNFLSVTNRIRETGSIQPLIDNFKRTALMFNVRAGGDDFFVQQPLLDSPTSYLFIIGIVYSIFKLSAFNYQLTLAGFILNLIPGFLSAPNGNRNIGVMPFVYLIAGIGLYAIFKLLKKIFRGNSSISATIVVLICSYGLINTYQLYLGSQRYDIFGFNPETTKVAYYMKSRLKTYDFYMTDDYPRDTLNFLTYTGGNPWQQNYTWFENKDNFLTVNRSANKGVVFIMFDTDENRQFAAELQENFPDGKLQQLRYIDDHINRPAALLFIVEKI